MSLKSLSSTYNIAGKTQSDLCRDYGVSGSALSKWVKQFSELKLEDNSVLTVKQIQELQKRNLTLVQLCLYA